MTRRPKKIRSARKAARKMARKATQPAKRAAAASAESLDALIAAGAKALGLKIEAAWMPAVRGHLEVTLRHGAAVAAFALPDESEPAPVFRA